MIDNKIIMRSYKDIKNTYKHIDIEKEYKDNNYLYQTLKRTSKMKHNHKIKAYQYDLKNLLSIMYKKLLFLDNPKVKIIREENDEFRKDYKSMSESFQKSIQVIFKDLIRKYSDRGYKVPNLSFQHNLFKINALIEDNNDKLELALKEDKKSKTPMKANKTMSYLRKLNNMLNIFMTKDENNEKNTSKFSMPKARKSIIYVDDVKELQKSIEKLKELIENNPLFKLEQKKSILLSRRKQSFGTSKQLESSKLAKLSIDFSSLKKNNKKSLVLTESTMVGTGENKNKSSNFLSLRSNTNKSSKSNQSIKTVNSQKEEISKNNKLKQEELLFSRPSETNKNASSRNSHQLINLKTTNMNLLNKQNETDEKEKEKDKTKALNLMSTEEKISYLYNKQTYYLNTIDSYKKSKICNKNINQDKNVTNDNNKCKSVIGKKKLLSQSKRLYKLKYLGQNSKNSFLKSSFLTKTQSRNKKSNSRNSNICLNLKNFDSLKTQNTFYTTQYKSHDEYLQKLYKTIKRGNLKKNEDLIRKYLNDIKHLKKDESDMIISHYSYKNMKNNISELKVKIGLDNLGTKTERLYLNNHSIKRVLPLLNSMKEQQINIVRFEKIISTGHNKIK